MQQNLYVYISKNKFIKNINIYIYKKYSKYSKYYKGIYAEKSNN